MGGKIEELFPDTWDCEPVIEYDYLNDPPDLDPYELMYLNKDIKKPERLPWLLSELTDELARYYDEGKWFHFQIEEDNLLGYVKNFYAVNEITYNQAKALSLMFGWGWEAPDYGRNC